ncbi:hypothetical protein WJX74_000460 [Apatococcus lobatus]|uniref:Uncharacterized protein n=1 Tax=Apatococcus lobatus TaxID=904363 RepID=A0AAW1RYA9_9CHLO
MRPLLTMVSHEEGMALGQHMRARPVKEALKLSQDQLMMTLLLLQGMHPQQQLQLELPEQVLGRLLQPWLTLQLEESQLVKQQLMLVPALEGLQSQQQLRTRPMEEGLGCGQQLLLMLLLLEEDKGLGLQQLMDVPALGDMQFHRQVHGM